MNRRKILVIILIAGVVLPISISPMWINYEFTRRTLVKDRGDYETVTGFWFFVEVNIHVRDYDTRLPVLMVGENIVSDTYTGYAGGHGISWYGAVKFYLWVINETPSQEIFDEYHLDAEDYDNEFNFTISHPLYKSRSFTLIINFEGFTEEALENIESGREAPYAYNIIEYVYERK